MSLSGHSKNVQLPEKTQNWPNNSMIKTFGMWNANLNNRTLSFPIKFYNKITQINTGKINYTSNSTFSAIIYLKEYYRVVVLTRDFSLSYETQFWKSHSQSRVLDVQVSFSYDKSVSVVVRYASENIIMLYSRLSNKLNDNSTTHF